MPQNAEASEWEEQKQTWQLASHWEVTTYHTSTRLQFTTLTQVTAYHISISVKPAGLGTGVGNLPSDLSLGFFITYYVFLIFCL
jgi:hypothetical protein